MAHFWILLGFILIACCITFACLCSYELLTLTNSLLVSVLGNFGVSPPALHGVFSLWLLYLFLSCFISYPAPDKVEGCFVRTRK
ncbi:hypothetical protein M5D96_008900, partial [Drosophila gunungcola]